MAQGLGRDSAQKPDKPSKSVRDGRVAGSRRIFAPQFKLQVLDSYRRDADCRGNQRATARKYGIHRRQIQKWLQAEASLRTSVEAALNLSPARQRDDSAEVAKPPPERARDSDDDPDVDVDVDVDADDEDDDDVDVMSAREPDRPLDFTCAALSKRRSFSLQFKLEVLDAFREDETCRGNQRATARKFGINRRQVQKWLGQEVELRGEAAFRGGMYRQRLGRWPDPDADDPNLDRCWDLSGKRTSEPVLTERTHLEVEDVPEKDVGTVQFGGSVYVDDVQETALCLKVERREPKDERASVAEVSGTVADLRYFEPGAYSFAPQPTCFCYSARMYRLYPAYPLDFGSPWVKPERHINMFR